MNCFDFSSSSFSVVPVISSSYKKLSYRSEVSGTKWFYDFAGENSSDARQRTGNSFSEGTSGKLGIPELGVGFSIIPNSNLKNISEFFVGYKKDLNKRSDTVYFGATVDITGISDP